MSHRSLLPGVMGGRDRGHRNLVSGRSHASYGDWHGCRLPSFRIAWLATCVLVAETCLIGPVIAEEPQLVLPGPVIAFPTHAPPPTVEQLQERQRQHAARVANVRQQIDELARLQASRREAAAAAKSPPETTPFDHEPHAPPHDHVDATHSTAHSSESHAAGNTSIEHSPHDAPNAKAHNDHTNHPTNVDGPIDRIGLADCLYAVGDLRAAEQVYRSVSPETLNGEQQAWVQFQLAGCDRKAGRHDDAQQKYRELVTFTEPQWLVELSRWWLTTLEDRQRLEGNAAKLSQIVQQLDTEVIREVSIDPRLLPDAPAVPAP